MFKKIISILCIALLGLHTVLGCQFIIPESLEFAGINYFKPNPATTSSTIIDVIPTNLPITFWFRLHESSKLNINDLTLYYAAGTSDQLFNSGIKFKKMPYTYKKELNLKNIQSKFLIYGNYTLQLLDLANDFPKIKNIVNGNIQGTETIYIIIICSFINADSANQNINIENPLDNTSTINLFGFSQNQLIVKPSAANKGIDRNNTLFLQWNGINRIVGR